MDILKELDKYEKWLIKCRRKFHQIPEIGMKEYKTSNLIKEYLEKFDIPYNSIVETGVVACLEGKKGDKVIAIRADIDGLPIEEKNNFSYKSRHKGYMHACGHDAHITIALGVAKFLSANKDKFSGKVKFIFQPAEETVGGAKPMIDKNVLKAPDVDKIFGLHVAPELEVGKIGLKYDQMNAASDTIKIIVKGHSTHGAYPHNGVDAIMISGQLLSAIQGIISRRVDPLEAAVISIGTINGGTQGNIISQEVEMVGTIRTLNHKTRMKVIKLVKDLVEKLPKSFDGEGIFIHEPGYCELINDNNIVNRVKNNAIEIFGEHSIEVIEKPSLGVEDFAYYLKEVPGAFFRLGCGNKEQGIVRDGHDPLFRIDEKCLKFGVSLQIKNILEALNEK